MATRLQSRFWRNCRTGFRRFRIMVWLAVLVLLSAFVYLNQVGLPDYFKKPLLENLRARGLDLRFSRLRLRWYRGLVADNVRFERADEQLSPHLTIQEVQVRLNHRALLRRRLQVDSLVLRQGRLVWPVAETNRAPRELAVENIHTELRFSPDDEWSLDHFTARFAGAAIKLSGTVAHGSAVRDWKFFQATPPAPARVWQDYLRQLADTLERIRFSAPPELTLDVQGDAHDLQSFTVRMVVSTPGADTPWGAVRGGRLVLRLYPLSTNGPARVDLKLDADEARTRWGTTANVQLNARLALTVEQTNLASGDLTLCAAQVKTQWGSATNLQLTLAASPDEIQTNVMNAELVLAASQVESPWGSATNARVNAQWAHALTNAIPLAGRVQLRCDQPDTRWASAKELRLDVQLAAPARPASARKDASWGGWAQLEPYALDWDGQLLGVRVREVEADRVACSGSWRAPTLTITNLHAEADRQPIEAHAALDVATRALRLSLASSVDPHRVAPLLTEGARRWLAPYSWVEPPKLSGEVSLVLPAWTNRQPDWRAEVQPSLELLGEFDIERGGAFKDWSFTSAHSHLSYSNLCWRLPDLTIGRPEGRISARLESSDRTKDFAIHLDSTVDPKSVRPLLEPGAQRGLDYFTFTEPPALAAQIRGRWQEPSRTGIQGRIALTNFTFRGESVSVVETTFQYTNRFLEFSDPRVQCGPRQARADGVGADFAAQRVYLTNGFSTVEPMVVARAIGPHVARAIEPYRFEEPPVARVHGTIPMHGEEDADLHFDLAGGPFDWWRFHVPHIAGHVHWLGQQLTLSNMLAEFYGGQAAGSARFNFHPRQETDYEFSATTTNTLLRPLMSDLVAPTNHLEGVLSGTLIITRANTASLASWNGHGEMQLRDGLIWDIPIFGIFSDVLNSMAPGLGNSRASAGTCTFGITNGVIASHDLDIRSTAMRLQYRGTVDFEGRVKARAEAGLLRDVWLVGPVVSTVFWPVTKIFEYKVSGSLGDPKAEPVYLIPKFMLLPFQMPFHPFRTLKGFLPEDSSESRTNGPALVAPKQQ